MPWKRSASSVIHHDRKGVDDEATDTEEAEQPHRQPAIASHPETPEPSSLDETLDPHDVATCDPKYWACPGANGLKASTSHALPQSSD